ncbi:MAG: M20/M25/M40 family metallo-hydrolase [Candidatus Bipolaricaulis sp.]|nr:M20/M25/M40 family metallo-hydrolase [Candidatus Bipolaricaulis sp.]
MHVRRLNLRELLGTVLLEAEVGETLHVLCDTFPGRWPGTPGGDAAAAYLERKLKEYGLDNVHAERFPLWAWKRGAVRIEAIAPFARPLCGLALPNTGSHDVEAEVVFADFSSLEEWRAIAPTVRGRIVFCQGSARKEQRLPIGRAQKARMAADAGAVGFAWVSEREGRVLLIGSVERDVGDAVPCVAVAREDAAALRRALDRGRRVALRMKTENEFREVQASNIVGEVPGGRSGEPLVIAGAHYDGHDIGDGAHDDASGTACMLEAARALSRYRDDLGSTLRFVLFTAEEMGVVGSRVYVDQHEAELDSIRFMLNVDGVGLSPDGDEYFHLPLGGPVVDRLREELSALQRPIVVEQGTMPLSWDHEGFALQGVPCGSLTDPVGGGNRKSWAHTSADSLDKLSVDGVRRAAGHVALILALVANDSAWPGTRLSSTRVTETLANLGIAEDIRRARDSSWRKLVIGR